MFDDDNELDNNSENEEQSIMGFASALGATFDVEVDTEKIKNKEFEKLKSESDFAYDLPDWDDNELEEYQSPNLKELIAAGEDFSQGIIDEGELKKTIQKISNELNKTVKEFEEIRKGEPDSITAREQVVRIEKAFSMYKEAFNEMNLFFKDKNKEHIDKGIQIAKKATNRLYKSFMLLQESSDVTTTKVCVQCSTRNPSTRNVCEKCGAQLPKVDSTPGSQVEVTIGGDPSQQVYYTNPNFDRLYREATELKKGNFSAKDFKKTIDWLCNNLLTAKREYEKLDTSFMSEEERKMFGDVFVYTKKAFEEYDKAFVELRKYFDDNDSSHLDNGLRIAFEATQVIAQVEQFSKQVEKTLKELESKQKKDK
jgi:ribosomal protein L40E